MIQILLASLTVFAAYFLKGLTGFGPALIMIPFFTLLFNPGTAISTTAMFDFLAGAFLIYSVRKELDWKFVFKIFAMLAIGAIFGSFILGNISEYWIKKIIGLAIFIFAFILLFQKDGTNQIRKTEFVRKLKYPVSLAGGFLGGFIGISGPPIIIYMKLLYDKKFFRTQLIGVFFFDAGWRIILYRMNNVPQDIEWPVLLLFFVIMLGAVNIGSHLHLHVNETLFNRIVAALLIIPALNLLIT